MAGIREPLEIIDRATAPLNRIAGAFGGAASAATSADTAAIAVNQILTGLSGSASIAAGSLRAVQYSSTTAVGALNAASQGAVVLGTSLRLAGQAGNNMADVVNRGAESMQAAFDRVLRSADEMGRRMEQAGRQGNQGAQIATQGVNQLGGAIRRVLGMIGGIAAIKGMISLSDDLSLMTTRLNNVNDGLQTTGELQRMIYDAAQRSRGSFQGMAQTVASLKAQTGDTFGSVREAVAFTELLQKQFKIAGTDATGIASTMYNLTQALSTGTLKGQDLNTVFANAPQLVQRIADYMNVPIGQIKELASQGKISADIVKNAILGAADDINEQFAAMPLTFGDAMQKLRNVAVSAFQPIADLISEAIASPQFDEAMKTIAGGFLTIANVARIAFEGIGNIIQWVGENLDWLGPIVMGVVAAWAIYSGVMTVVTAAQAVYNAVLAACPLVWVVLAVAAVIGAIVALVMWMHNAAATGHTVFGDIAGVAMGCFNVILNALKIVGNFFLTVAEGIVNGWNQMVFTIQTAIINFAQGAIRAFASVVRGAENAANAIATAFVNGANAAIGGINALINAINQIPGVNLSTVGTIDAPQLNNDLSNAIEGVAASLESMKPEAVEQVSFERFEVESVADAFNSGFEQGSAFGDSVAESFSGLAGDIGSLMGGTDMGDLMAGMGDLGDAMGGASGTGGGKGGKGNVGSVDKVKKVENVKLSDEDMKIYKDLAEQRYLNRIELQTLAPNITVTIPGGMANGVTADDVADRLKVLLIEQAAAHGAVAHA